MLPSSDRPLRPEGGAGPFWRLFVHGPTVRFVGLVAGPKFDATRNTRRDPRRNTSRSIRRCRQIGNALPIWSNGI